MPETITVNSAADAQLAMQQIVAETMGRAAKANYADVLRKVLLPKLQQWHAGYFASDTDPSGRKWAPLSPVTVKKKGHDTILEESRAMLRSLIGQTDLSIARVRSNSRGSTLEYGTKRENAWKHQEGYPPGRIPKREFVGINRKKLAAVVEMITDDLVKQIKQTPGQMRAAS